MFRSYYGVTETDNGYIYSCLSPLHFVIHWGVWSTNQQSKVASPISAPPHSTLLSNQVAGQKPLRLSAPGLDNHLFLSLEMLCLKDQISLAKSHTSHCFPLPDLGSTRNCLNAERILHLSAGLWVV